REFQLDSARLGRWVKALDLEETSSQGHPLHAWAKMAAPGSATAEQFQKRRQALQAALEAQQADSARAAVSVHRFEDFRAGTYDGWFATGDAFGSGPAQAGDFVIGGSAE